MFVREGVVRKCGVCRRLKRACSVCKGERCEEMWCLFSVDGVLRERVVS